MLHQKHKKILLKLAYQAIATALSKGRLTFEVTDEDALKVTSGAFVSLHCLGQLRGCIGRIRSRDPLERIVQEMAVAAATQDFRFRPLRQEELAQLEIEISVLTQPEVIHDVEQIEMGKHGIIVSDGPSSAVFLPQVAPEQGWDRDTYLSECCAKAGLPLNHWVTKHPKIEIFTAEVFSY